MDLSVFTRKLFLQLPYPSFVNLLKPENSNLFDIIYFIFVFLNIILIGMGTVFVTLVL